MRVNAVFHCSRRSLFFASLSVMVLVSWLFVGIFVINCCGGASLENAVHVKNEEELKNAINRTPDGKSTIIAIDNDIALTSSLKIPVNKDITLVSSKLSVFYKLIGAESVSTIFVDDGGVLRIDGVIVTHVKIAGPLGGGVYVEANGLLILYSGEISGNNAIDPGDPRTPTANGGGVYNRGTFEMYGGKISDNSAVGMGSRGGGQGGGVSNTGTFVMSGGEISGNYGHVSGGGVDTDGTFVMSGGKIINNRAFYRGGGVRNFGVFEWLGGVISGNTAGSSGDNVYPGDDAGGVGDSAIDNGDGGFSSGGGSGSNGDGGFSSGGGSGSNGDGGFSAGGDGFFRGGFSLRDVVFVCLGVAVVVVGVVVAVLLFTFKKDLNARLTHEI